MFPIFNFFEIGNWMQLAPRRGELLLRIVQPYYLGCSLCGWLPDIFGAQADALPKSVARLARPRPQPQLLLLEHLRARPRRLVAPRLQLRE